MLPTMASGPVARVLAALALLQTHRRITGPDLARRLGVDVRTVRRYVATLEELGIPVAAERGRDGAYALVAGYTMPPLMFEAGEVVALAVGLVAARGLGLSGETAAAASAEAKLERVMPEGLRKRARALADTVALELARPRAPGNDRALAALAAAASGRERVDLRYRDRRSAESSRRFDPYALARRGGYWYAVGHCHLRRGLRSFRLDRVVDVRQVGEAFEPAPAFDALAHLSRSIATIPRRHTAEVFLGANLDTARRELFPAAGVLEPAAGGSILRAQADDLGWLARELCRLPFPFEVRLPRALAREVAAHAARVAGCVRRGRVSSSGRAGSASRRRSAATRA
jgi:predicted DNA-binding transcriptional regulator YafY